MDQRRGLKPGQTMNLLLIHPEDMQDAETAAVHGRRHEHIRDILKAAPGDVLRAGRLNGPFGQAEVREVRENETVLGVQFGAETPAPPRVSVILAMVRPRIARQTLTALASMGVRRIMFINARRVEKPYFSQRLFDADQYKEFLYLGLEQGGETWMPEVTIHERFKLFVEEELEPLIPPGSRRHVAHPVEALADADFRPPAPEEDVVLAIGPEGGWIDYEVQHFREHSFKPLRLGGHILRVETAIPYAFGKLHLG